jgi:hypothetical protein
MSWVRRWKGKHVHINRKNPAALGVCDDSGFDFNHKHLIKQMEWRGDRLVWTGFLVGQPYLDVPQEQNRPPLVKNDPRPVLLSRVPGTSRQSIYNPPGSIGMPNGPVTSVYMSPENPPPIPNSVREQQLRETNWNWENS